MRFQVPQFVDIEDKIIGPFTLKQFLMYAFATMLLVPVYLFSDLSLFITIAIPIVGIAAAFAHLKVNGKSLFQVLANAASFYTGSPLYVWRRTNKINLLTIRDSQWEEFLEASKFAEQDLITLSRTAQRLETSGNVVQSDDVVDEIASEQA